MITRNKINCIKKIQKNVRGHLIRRKLNPYKYIKYYYNRYLKKYGCKLPSEKSSFGKALEYLYINIKKENNINDIRNYVLEKNCTLNDKVSDNLQIRHLGLQYGFNMLKGNDIKNSNQKIKKSNYCLINLTNKHINYLKEKRSGKLNNENWYELKKNYNFCCANCGNEEGKPMRYNYNQLTDLQQGHMDPRKSLTLENTIPQCSYCNQQYKNKAIFNKKGIVIEFNKNGF